MSFQNKYLKYKNKYLDLKNKITQKGGSDSNTTNKCAKCGTEENLSKCSQCKSVFYCSREHQKQDWKKHQKVCIPQLPTSDTITSKVELNPSSSTIITSNVAPSPSSSTIITSKVEPSPSSVTVFTSKVASSPSSSTVSTSKVALSSSSSTVSTNKVEPISSTSSLDDELSIRRRAGEIALESFIGLNNSYDYSNGPLEHIKYKYNGWHQNFVYPPTTLKQDIKDKYNQINYRPKPRFNLTEAELEKAFNFFKEPNPKQVLECRAAMYMVNMRIFYKLLPDFFRYLFDISIIDQIIERNPKLVQDINGYDETFEIEKLQYMYKMGILDDLNDINKVLLNERKAKRLYMVDLMISNILLMNPDKKSSEIKIGNTYYILGHPNYDHSWGENSGVFVICVDIISSEPLFIGFSGNQIFSGRPSFKFERPLPLSVIQEGLTKGYVDDMAKAISSPSMSTNMSKINRDHLNLGEFPKLVEAVKKIPINHIYNLNIQNIINQKNLLLLPKKSIDTKVIQDQEIISKYKNNEDLIKIIKEE